MTVFVDIGVLYADHDQDASRHTAASAALDAVYDGEFGQPYVSDYIYDEAVTLTLKRGGAFIPARQLGAKLWGSIRIRRHMSCSVSQRQSSKMLSMCSNATTIRR